MEGLDWKKCWQKCVGSVYFSALFSGYFLLCLNQVCSSGISCKKYILTWLYKPRGLENPVMLLCVPPSPNQTSFNHAFLIIWLSDLNCQCSGSCVNPLKYPGSYKNFITKQGPYKSCRRSVQPPAVVLGRMPLMYGVNKQWLYLLHYHLSWLPKLPDTYFNHFFKSFFPLH